MNRLTDGNITENETNCRNRCRKYVFCEKNGLKTAAFPFDNYLNIY